MAIHEISVAPEVLWEIGPFEISDTAFTAMTVSVILIVLAILVRTRMSLIPGRLQLMFEMVIEYFLNQLTLSTGSEKRARKLLPFIASLFLLLVVANQFLLIPFVGSVMWGEAHLFKGPSAHYSLPIAMALMGLGMSHVIAFATHPLRYSGHFVKLGVFLKVRSFKDFFMAFIEFFIGLMETVGELAKFISLSTRLFGNLFAGEVVVAIISGLFFATQFLVPIPFMMLEILAGLVQAFVFTTLSMIFMSSTLNKAYHAEHH